MSGAWGPPRKVCLQILYSGLNRYLKYLFRRCMMKLIVTAAERRERITAEISERTGITEAMIERLVRAFYDKVRADPVLGPIFAARIDNWEPHLQQMFAFWS